MNTTTLLKKLVGLSVLLFSFYHANGQEKDCPFPIDSFFNRIILDDELSYKNLTTGEIISSAEYNGIIALYSNNSIDQFCSEYWCNKKVNPYKDVELETPFKISFEQESFTMPVDVGLQITSRFGRRRRGPHRGIDLDLVTGDNVRSVLPGKVRFVGYSRGHGKTIVVRHANEVETVYAHLSAYNVKVNDSVTEGQIIGKGGNTGNSRGSHLHLEVRYKGVCIHPEYVFDFESLKVRGKELWVTNGWKSATMHSSYRQSKVEPLCTHDHALAYQESEPKYHKVRKGDTLSEIARSYSIGLSHLCNLNGLSKTAMIRIGQSLQIR